MIYNIDFNGEFAESRRIYEDFSLPVFICDTAFNTAWHNRAAVDAYPRLTDSDGIRRLLGEFDTGALLKRLTRDEVLHIDGTPAFTGVKLSLMPIRQDGELRGVTVMMVGPQAVISRPNTVESSKTHENIETSIRAGIAEMFDIMDNSAKKADWLDDAAVLRAFAGIERSGYRLLRIAANISSYTRFQLEPPSLPAKAVDVFDLIRESQPAVYAFAQETGISVRFDLPDENESAIAAIDEGCFQIAYSNLLNNAFYFTKAGNEIKITGKIDEDHIVFTVLDNGVGIPKGFLPDTVFKPYVSCGHGNNPPGIGLGLTLVKMVADGCGGSITVTSKENEWTAATFSLPKHALSSGLPFRQDTFAHTGGYDDRFSYASVSLRAAADSPYHV